MPVNKIEGKMTYRDLIRSLQRGEQPPVDDVEAVLRAAGKTAGDLVRDWLRDPPPRPGDRCARCGGTIKVLNTRRICLNLRAQYVGCGTCGFRPPRNKRVLRS